MGKKILLGIALWIISLVLVMEALYTPITIQTEWGPRLAPNFPLLGVGIIVWIVGFVLLVWGLYQWQRKKAIEIIAEGVRKAQEKK